MYLIEEHIISKNHSFWKECDRLCFASKNIYNHSLYKIQEYKKSHNKLLSGYDLYHIVKHEECFKSLPNDCAKQTIFQAVDMWKYFLKSIKSWKINKTKFTGCPKPPKYKHKEKGRNIVTIPIRNCRLKSNKILFNKHIKLELKTKVSNLVEVKIVPQNSCYKIQVCYKIDEKIKSNSFNKVAIDLGVNNLCTISNNFGQKPFIINGKPLKSINHFYNKKRSNLQKHLTENKYTSKNLTKLANKRNNKIKHVLHCISKYVINYCVQNNVSEIAIGYNELWKQKINLGSKTNQNFVNIPFLTLINQFKYKAKVQGISVLLHEESYTSKTSAFDREEPVKQSKYKGKRIKRGLFKTANNFLVNSDYNGSIQIGYKVFGNSFRESNIGCVVHPFKVNLNK